MAGAHEDRIDALFGKLYEQAKQVDQLNAELKKKLDGKCTLREPATTLCRLNEEVVALEDEITPELAAIKKHNLHLNKTIEMVKATMKYKRETLTKIKSNIQKYTVEDEPSNENAVPKEESKSRFAVAVDSSREKKHAGSAVKMPLRNSENTRVSASDHFEKEIEEPVEDIKASSAPCTPIRSRSPVEQIATPRLTDYLSLDTMYEILDATNLITKSSKKSSTKKPAATPANMYSSVLTRGSTVKSRRGLLQTTPGNKTLAMESPMSTPVMPELLQIKKPLVFDIPKLDFAGRIAMIDVDEYHSRVDNYIKGLVSLELINKVINSVDTMCKMNPEVPVGKDELFKLIKPMAGPKAKLCINILETFKRLKPVPGRKELMVAVHGRPL